MNGYKNDQTWRKVQAFLPTENRLTENSQLEEYFIALDSMDVHIDCHVVICL